MLGVDDEKFEVEHVQTILGLLTDESDTFHIRRRSDLRVFQLRPCSWIDNQAQFFQQFFVSRCASPRVVDELVELELLRFTLSLSDSRSLAIAPGLALTRLLRDVDAASSAWHIHSHFGVKRVWDRHGEEQVVVWLKQRLPLSSM